MDQQEGSTNDDHSLADAAMAVAIASATAEEEESLWGGGVVEEMTWSSVWLPFWDVEFVGRNYGVLFSDVAWGDDIWNLKNLTHSSVDSRDEASSCRTMCLRPMMQPVKQ